RIRERKRCVRRAGVTAVGEDLVEGAEAAGLVRATRDGAAGEHEAELSGPDRSDSRVALLDDGDAAMPVEPLLELHLGSIREGKGNAHVFCAKCGSAVYPEGDVAKQEGGRIQLPLRQARGIEGADG